METPRMCWHEATTDPDTMAAAQASRMWYRVTGSRGNAKGLTGTEGRLAWFAVEGSPKALSSSPDRLRVTRVGLIVEGRRGLLFVNVSHISAIPQPSTAEDRVAIEIGLTNLASVFA